MKQLKQLSHSQLNTQELQFFALQAMGLIAPHLENSPFAFRQHGKLLSATNNVEALTGLSRKSDSVASVGEADDVQDTILIAIRETCKAKISTAMFNANAAEAAEDILDIMGEYGRDLIYGNYEQQSVAIPSFSAKMKVPANAEKAQKAGVKTYLDALDPAHAEFQNLLNIKLTGTETPATTVTDEKKVIRYRVDSLLSYLDVQIADGIEPYTALKEPMNILITDVMSRMKTRLTRKENSAQ